MVDYIVANTRRILVEYTMSRDAAEEVKNRFEELNRDEEEVSYLDCALFDAALEVLGEYQEYNGLTDEEWEDELADRERIKSQYKVKVIDVTDTWREVM